MGEIWIKEAERLGDGSIGGAMDTPGKPGRVVWHTTESGAGNAAFNSVAVYLRQIGAEPQFLYDPTTDRLGQFGPMNESGRALKNDGATRTNRTGKVCVQIEVLAKASKPFTEYWKPGPNFKALMRAIRSWGVPDVFPMGTPAATSGACKRDRAKWLATGGHYGHCNVPGNDHWDPGAISPAKLFAAAPVTKPVTPAPKPTPKPAPKPAVDLSNIIDAAKRDPHLAQGKTTHPADVKLVEAALKAEGLLTAAYATDGSFGDATVRAYAMWQQRCGVGTPYDGIPGKSSLTKLGSKHGFTVKA